MPRRIADRPDGAVGLDPALLARAAFIIASHTTMLWFLRREGLSAYGVLVIAAGESLLVGGSVVVVQAVSRRFPTEPRRRRWHLWEVAADILVRGAMLVLVFGGTMALFLWAVVLVAQPEQALGLDSQVFRQAAGYVALAVLGQALVDLVRVVTGQSARLQRIQAGAFLHILIGVLVSSFGAVLVLLMNLPLIGLAALIALKSLADLAVEAFVRSALSAGR